MQLNSALTNALAAALWLSLAAAGGAATPDSLPEARGATRFAPVPEGHELAGIWNDPEFTKRLLGSYGFATEVEPRLAPDELATYRDKVVPLLRQDPKKAQKELAALAKPGASAVFDFTLGNLCFQEEDLTNAVKHFEAAIAKYPDYRRAHQNLGFVLAREGKYAAAIKPMTRAIALGAGDGKIFGLLGFAYASTGRNVSAEAAYRQALVYDPENVEFKLGLVKSAVAAANYAYALALLDELTTEYPERDTLWLLQANLFIQQGTPAKAVVSLEMLRRADKASVASLYLLGDLHMSQESPDLALEAYLAALGKDAGQNPSRALRAAQILVSRSAWVEAGQLFARIRQASPALPASDELKLLKLESKLAMSTGAGDTAIKTLEQIITKDPLDGEALLLAGDYYGKHGEKEKAELRYQTAATLEGYEAEAMVKQAQLLVRSQKYPQAVDLLKKAQKIKNRENVQRYLERVEQLARNSGNS